MLCRICLKNTIPDNLMPLFDGVFPHKIEVISSVKLVENDLLPSMVCTRCALNINLAFNFRLVIIKSDLLLHNKDHSAQNLENTRLSVNAIDNDNGILDDIKLDIKDEVIEHEVYSDNDRNKMQVDHFDDNPENVRQYECNQCDFKPETYKKLLDHRRIHHYTGSVICSVCSKSLLPANMKKHMVTHYGSPATCKVCGFISKTSESLRSHMLYHKGHERICHICGKVYAHSSQFKVHVRRHTSPKGKIHKCHLCDNSFADKGTLQRHIRSHTGERPYICEFCKKGFSSTNALKTHRRQHTKERPYACSMCPMAFPQRVSLRTHLKSKHDYVEKKY